MSGGGRLAVLALFAALAAGAAFRLGGFAIDDVFITYRYAASFAAGDGLVYTPGERVYGTTSPGLAVLLGTLARGTGAPVPRLGAAVTALALAAIAGLLFRAGAGRGRAAEGFAAGLLVVGSPLAWVHVGNETAVALALLLAAAALRDSARDGSARRELVETTSGVAPVARQEVAGAAAVVRAEASARRRGIDALAGALAGAAAVVRPEALAGTVILALLMPASESAGGGGRSWAGRLRSPSSIAFLAAAGAVVGAAALALAAWFGGPLPETLAAKRLHVAWMPEVWASGLAFWPAAGRALVPYLTSFGLVALLALGVPGLALLLLRGRSVERLLALFALVLLAAYPLLGVPMYAWYALVPCLALLAGAAHAAGALARALAGWLPISTAARRAVAATVGVGLVVAVGGPPAVRLASFLSGEVAPVRYEVYRATGEWLRRNSAPDARVAALEVGTIGFFSERPIHDLMGLVGRDARPALAAGDLSAAFLAGDPDLFVSLRPENPLLAAIEGAPWFAAAYRPVARLRHREAGFATVVYRRRSGAGPANGAEGAGGVTRGGSAVTSTIQASSGTGSPGR